MTYAKTIGLPLFLVALYVGAGIAHADLSQNQTGSGAFTPPIRTHGPVDPVEMPQESSVSTVVPTVPPAMVSAAVPVPAVVESPAVPLGMPQPITPDKPDVAKAEAPAPHPEIVVDTWRARKGESLHDVLQRWAVRGHADLMWASATTPFLKEDFSYVGRFQNAVNKLIQDTAPNKIHSQYRSEGLNPVMMAPASTVTTSPPPVVVEDKKEVVKDVSKESSKETPKDVTQQGESQAGKDNALARIFEPKKEKEVAPETRWFGLAGSPLAEVIQVWADDAGVRVIWGTEKNFALKETVSQIGHFEDAVFKALSQYDAESIRPVGEMYNDPKTGQKVLFVRSDVK